MFPGQEHIDHQNAVAHAIEYVRYTGRQKVLDIIAYHGWSWEVDANNQYIEAKYTWPAINDNPSATVRLLVDKDFSKVEFRGWGIDEVVLYWVPEEARFCTFTFRKLEAKEIPEYFELLVKGGAKALKKRLSQYKQSF
jgi:hypothetical protein